ncbi:hypothetical protein D3C73_1271520 [compost metagenome]
MIATVALFCTAIDFNSCTLPMVPCASATPRLTFGCSSDTVTMLVRKVCEPTLKERVELSTALPADKSRVPCATGKAAVTSPEAMVTEEVLLFQVKVRLSWVAIKPIGT